MSKSIDSIIADIEFEIKRGNTQIAFTDLLEYLKKKKESPDVRFSEFFFKSQADMFRTVIEYGQLSLKNGLLLTGGAAVALLAFAGNVALKKPDWVAGLMQSAWLFAMASFLIALSTFATYLTQGFYYRHLATLQAQSGWRTAGKWFHAITFIAGLTAAILFILATLVAKNAILSCQ